jgi:hypothetical protein
MLAGNLGERPLKRATACQPFVDHDAQRILITDRARFALDLLRSHIGDRANDILGKLVARTLGHRGNAKVADQNLVVGSQQHVLRLDISMDQFLAMGVV